MLENVQISLDSGQFIVYYRQGNYSIILKVCPPFCPPEIQEQSGVLPLASILPKTDGKGNVVAYKITVYLGRDDNNKKVRKAITIPRPQGLTEKKEEKQVRLFADNWESEQRKIYEDEELRKAAELAQITGKTKFVDFIDKVWIPRHVKDGNHTPDTVSFYTHEAKAIRAYFNENKKDITVSEVSKEDVLDYLKYLRTEAMQKNGKPYSATTIQHRFSTLRNILEYAVYIDYISEDPCKKLKQSDKPKRQEKEIDFLQEGDAINFLACLESDAEKEYWETNKRSYVFWKALVNIFIVTGLRRGELVGLQWRDIDDKNMMLKIRRNVSIDTTHKGEKDPAKKMHIGETKGKQIRKVPVSNYVLTLLGDLKEEQKKIHGDDIPSDAFVFCRAENIMLPIYPTEPTRLMRKFIDRHSLPNVSPHDLRHTAASLAIQSGANVKEIQKMLGHKDAATTLKFYTGISEKAQRDTVNRIESILRPSKTDNSKKGPET